MFMVRVKKGDECKTSFWNLSKKANGERATDAKACL